MSGNAEHITRADIISGHLHRLQTMHTLLSVNIPGKKQYYNSMLISIDDNKHHILLDVLHPDSGHQALMQEKSLIVSANHNGVELGFKSKVEALVNDDGKPAYRVLFPAKLIYKQQRQTFRASVALDNLIPVEVDDNKKTCAGHIVNLSSGGMCLQFENPTAINFERGQVLNLCRFNIDKKTVFQSSAKICNISTNKTQRLTRIGVQFVDLANADERQLQRLVSQLERAMIQRSNKR